ncbi:class I SAM-dependent methyltransferase, partial [bacterium]|nr:class I SAM-dependent methyltransferase [bacterium]
KYDYYSDEDLRIIRKCLPSFPPNSKLLDLACGSGVIGEHFQSQFSKINVIGTDICLPLLKWASYYKCQSDACFLPFSDHSFDCIIAAAAFHHFPNIGKAVKECSRCLKPGGFFLAYDPNKFHPQRFVMMTDPLRHIFYKSGDHAVSPVHLRKILIKDNFERIRIRYVAFRGRGGSFLAGLNYKVAIDLSDSRLKWILPLTAPWFVITAIKR